MRRIAVGMAVALAALTIGGQNAQSADAAGGWDGLYAGIAGGGTFGSSNQIDAGPDGSGETTHGYDISGGLFGGTVGYNLQTGPWVYGLEGDFSWTNAQGQAHEIPPFTTSSVVGTSENWLGTARARFGWAVANQVLIYATGGFAVASVAATVATVSSGNPSETQTRWGGTVGGGVEAMLAPRWSVKAEYLYVDLQGAEYFNPPPGPSFNIRSNVPVDQHLFRLGIAYHFGAF
jgi:outer membrane immunogenic protein